MAASSRTTVVLEQERLVAEEQETLALEDELAGRSGG
jgi:hypothetical protein